MAQNEPINTEQKKVPVPVLVLVLVLVHQWVLLHLPVQSRFILAWTWTKRDVNFKFVFFIVAPPRISSDVGPSYEGQKWNLCSFRCCCHRCWDFWEITQWTQTTISNHGSCQKNFTVVKDFSLLLQVTQTDEECTRFTSSWKCVCVRICVCIWLCVCVCVRSFQIKQVQKLVQQQSSATVVQPRRLPAA